MRAVLAACMTVVAFTSIARADHREILQVSLGPTGGNGGQEATYDGQSSDGRSIFFDSAEALVADDANGVADVYERRDGTTTLVSRPEPDATGAGAGFVAASPDGAVVVLLSNASLVSEDDDGGHSDLYIRAGGHTTLISPTDPDAFGFAIGTPSYLGMSATGNKILFSTAEALLPSDSDGTRVDIYSFELDTGQLRRESRGAINGNGPYGATSLHGSAVSDDGNAVFFTTREQLVADDTDAAVDVYATIQSTTRLVSTTQTASPQDATLLYRTPDGHHAFFETTEALDANDTDDQPDIYRWDEADDSVGLMSVGTQAGVASRADFQRASPDGTRVWWTTSEQLVASDTDQFSDIYLRDAAGETTVESRGPGGGNGGPDDLVFSGTTVDGARMYFTTHEQLTADDTDSATDVYERVAGSTRRVSVGAQSDNAGWGAFFAGVSDDGSRVLFGTDGPLTATDLDDQDDVYEWDGTSTTLLTGGATSEPAVYGGIGDDARQLVFNSIERLAATDLDADNVDHSCSGPGLSDGCDVFVSRINRSPVVSVSSGFASAVAGGAAVLVDAAIEVVDSDTAQLTGARAVLAGGGGTLALTPPSPTGLGAVVSDAGTVITLSGTGTPGGYQEVLRHISLEAHGLPGARTVTFTVSDGADVSAPVTRTVSVTAAPVVSGQPDRPVETVEALAPTGDVVPALGSLPPGPSYQCSGLRASASIRLRRLRSAGIAIGVIAGNDMVAALELRLPTGPRVSFAHVRAFVAGVESRELLKITGRGERRLETMLHRELHIVVRPKGPQSSGCARAIRGLLLRR